MSIYKECDIRGIYGEDINDEIVYLIGRALGHRLTGEKAVVGGDVRLSTPALIRALITGMLESGIHVINLGTIPTPLMYFAKMRLNAAGGIMVTASHNPAAYNGIKLMIGDMPVKPEDIEELETLISRREFVNKQGKEEEYSIEEEYIDFILPRVKKEKTLKVVVDAGNGTASELAPETFRLAGHNVVELFCEFDGNFPNRNPNPAVYSNLKILQDTVLENQADLGVAFDGDGDRVIFVDNLGRFCESERSFILFIREYLSGKKSSVVYDGKSSSVVRKTVEGMGSSAIIERSGHAFIKNTFIKNKSELAGEISGHFFFKELGHDDGIYAALVMAGILSRKKESLAEIMNGIEKTVITPDLRIKSDEKRIDRLISDLNQWESYYPVSRIDGIRIEFPSGWVLVRKSVTEPCVTVRLEAETVEDALEINEKIFREKYREIHKLIDESIEFNYIKN